MAPCGPQMACRPCSKMVARVGILASRDRIGSDPFGRLAGLPTGTALSCRQVRLPQVSLGEMVSVAGSSGSLLVVRPGCGDLARSRLGRD